MGTVAGAQDPWGLQHLMQLSGCRSDVARGPVLHLVRPGAHVGDWRWRLVGDRSPVGPEEGWL
eukprot:9615387-Alexandrium_andersonii.AAC.1